jgi:anti-sigma factor RsiW
MAERSPLNDQDRADLVAYLDGELKGEAARAVETRLALNPDVRAEADALKRTWELLDFLPRAEPSPDFTHRTVSLVAPLGVGKKTVAGLPPWRPWLLGAGWAAAVLVAAATGYTATRMLAPRQPGEPELVRDLRIIENKRLYEQVEDIEFLRQLDSPDLFGEESVGS